MANLVDQIKEMIDILQAVDPAAAAAFRGGPPNRLMNIVEPKATIQDVSPNITPNITPNVTPNVTSNITTNITTNITPTTMSRQNIGRQTPGRISSAAEMENRASERNPLGIKLNTNNLIEGIIYSEILGKPLSKRRNHGKP